MSRNNSRTYTAEKDFFDICNENFKYLKERYDFLLVSERKESGNLYKVLFQNQTTAVIVNWDRNENWIFIELYRLINNKLMVDPINITNLTSLNGYYFDDLLSIRCPHFLPQTSSINEISLEGVLINYSMLLRKHAVDILEGDFTVFSELEKIVKARLSASKEDKT